MKNQIKEKIYEFFRGLFQDYLPKQSIYELSMPQHINKKENNVNSIEKKLDTNYANRRDHKMQYK